MSISRNLLLKRVDRWGRRTRRCQHVGRRLHVQMEALENRYCLTAPAQHVLILSIDGLHQADLTDPQLRQFLRNIRALERIGVSYSNDRTTSPSDSFPATLSFLTGAGPATTGVYYDDTYSRTLYAPGSNVATAQPGTPINWDSSIDINSNLLSGGGNFDASSIDTSMLPLNSRGQPVYPRQFLQVNTIFDVAHDAGLYTALIDKHPSYEIAYGNNPNAINDFYAPEIDSNTALLDNATGQTINADALQAANPFANLSGYTLVDASTDPEGPNDPNLEATTNNVLLTEKYDDLKVQALLNEIAGRASHSSPNITNPQVPNLFEMNFQAVNTAEVLYLGGINRLRNGKEAPSAILESAIEHTDNCIGEIVAALKNAGLWRSTEVFLTAKHGQDPRVGPAGLMSANIIPNLLTNAGAPAATITEDDIALIWLQNQSTTQTAANALQKFKNTGTVDVYYGGVEQTLPASRVINKILYGQGLVKAGLGNPATDSTTPDIIVTMKSGYFWTSPPTQYQDSREDHGGFSADDTDVPLIVFGGAVPHGLQGLTVDTRVMSTQIAVSALDALGLDPSQLQGAVIDHTQPLPGLGSTQGGNDPIFPGRVRRATPAPLVRVNLPGFKPTSPQISRTGPKRSVSLVIWEMSALGYFDGGIQ
jgi:hypothetical protein